MGLGHDIPARPCLFALNRNIIAQIGLYHTRTKGQINMRSSRRDHLVETAQRLFAEGGYHATGIDKVLAEAGVAKMTLYKHFKSKDELILAALRRRDETFRNWFMREVERRTPSPRARLLAVFDVLDDWFGSPRFNGCMFINAASEYGGSEHPIHAAACEHKRLLCAYLAELARAAGAQAADDLARQLLLLVEGATVTAQIECAAGAARHARAAAEVLVSGALDRPAGGAPQA
jgi:AcrR family transcriptional regulator